MQKVKLVIENLARLADCSRALKVLMGEPPGKRQGGGGQHATVNHGCLPARAFAPASRLGCFQQAWSQVWSSALPVLDRGEQQQ